MSRPMAMRVCSMDRCSDVLGEHSAQKSTTWVPCVLMTSMAAPRATRTARPGRAGMSSSVMITSKLPDDPRHVPAAASSESADGLARLAAVHDEAVAGRLAGKTVPIP
jgi:hypothetical protein